MSRKRGAEELPTGPAAGFILMFLLFFVIYIIIIPTQDKAELAGDESILGGPGSGDYTNPGGARDYSYRGSYRSNALLSESPGHVFPYVGSVVAQPLGAVDLYVDDEENTVYLAQDIEASKSFWSDDSKTLTFALENTNVQQADLYFFVVDGEGKLAIEVNGALVYEGEIAAGTVPIHIPATYLRKNNRITFSAEGVGINFFGSNTYRLKEVALQLQQSLEHTREQRSFTLTSTEFPNLARLSLVYFTNCRRIQDRGVISIYLNGQLVDRHTVVCEVGPLGQDLPLSATKAGTNALEFEIDKGSYVLEQMVLEKEYNQVKFQTYQFSVSPDLYADVRARHADAFVTVQAEGAERMVADILINGVLHAMDTAGGLWEEEISRSLIEGRNTLKIIPRNEFDILNLEVAVEE
ncbi:MAG TPA: hypothetical protein VJJ75_00840 [Candidatus Nanoarchaeia archaeon]|nr:hypothetical protein [Candidatus Nanoarchaeia archaeon]